MVLARAKRSFERVQNLCQTAFLMCFRQTRQIEHSAQIRVFFRCEIEPVFWKRLAQRDAQQCNGNQKSTASVLLSCNMGRINSLMWSVLPARWPVLLYSQVVPTMLLVSDPCFGIPGLCVHSRLWLLPCFCRYLRWPRLSGSACPFGRNFVRKSRQCRTVSTRSRPSDPQHP